MEKTSVLKEIIEGRKSIFPKSYSAEEIDGEVLNEIINSGNYAPNHKRTKPWRFRTFRNEEKNQLGVKLAEIYKQTCLPQAYLEKKYLDISDKISKTDTIITICVNFSGLLPEWEEIAATSMAVQNMYLTATAYEIGCYWSTPGMIQHVGDYLSLEDNQKCIGFFYLGKVAR
ncbi:nitroreductase [Chryseobacterium sp. SNU WT5]|uniref:nitroreductase family protein n=1 Tax=Chryseobacterium sp. SNU WT5 TaxID=2594269 RepID=UPI00117BEBA7|nr:nitroreductase [Chryseobacterium sp. SNU WT5]QDP85943.1 nitroreductase [Chryseobacterium sp. SNU WT5]